MHLPESAALEARVVGVAAQAIGSAFEPDDQEAIYQGLGEDGI